MATATQPPAHDTQSLKLDSVDCDRCWDFTLWLNADDALLQVDVIVETAKLGHGEVVEVTAVDAHPWAGKSDLTVDEANAFIRANHAAVCRAADEAHEYRMNQSRASGVW